MGERESEREIGDENDLKYERDDGRDDDGNDDIYDDKDEERDAYI